MANASGYVHMHVTTHVARVVGNDRHNLHAHMRFCVAHAHRSLNRFGLITIEAGSGYTDYNMFEDNKTPGPWSGCIEWLHVMSRALYLWQKLHGTPYLA